uniref:Uncharacterized protein n=1 Tax=Vespula pensylvanica TaxID=30213 RepID=A0A834U7N1_VESPE|nr:hypothetical protein H0235_010377 [Vespula pensylvanica]
MKCQEIWVRIEKGQCEGTGRVTRQQERSPRVPETFSNLFNLGTRCVSESYLRECEIKQSDKQTLLFSFAKEQEQRSCGNNVWQIIRRATYHDLARFNYFADMEITYLRDITVSSGGDNKAPIEMLRADRPTTVAIVSVRGCIPVSSSSEHPGNLLQWAEQRSRKPGFIIPDVPRLLRLFAVANALLRSVLLKRLDQNEPKDLIESYEKL